MASGKLFDFSVLCRHCERETTEPIGCSVTGSVPAWADGVYVYNGPGLTKVGKTPFQHCFDSSAILQRVRVSGGTAQYMSRYLRSETYKKNTKAGTITVGEFGTAPVVPEKERGFFSKLKKMTDMENVLSDNSAVSIASIGGRYFALGETPFMQEICLDTLETKQRRNLYREGSMVTTAPHPVYDKEGNCYTVGHAVSLTGPKYNILKFPAEGGAPQVAVRLNPRWRLSPSYMHSLGITERFLVILELPLAVSVSEVVSDVFNNLAFLDGMKWHEESTFVHLIELSTMKPLRKKYVVKPLFMLHVANCYEDASGNVVVDFPSYGDVALLHKLYIDKLRQNMKSAQHEEFRSSFYSSVTRLVLPVSESDTRTEVPVKVMPLSATAALENPVINPVYGRRKHRYIYGMGVSGEGGDRGQVTKLDVETGEVKLLSEETLYCGECVFVPKPGAGNEDDGVVVSFCVRSDEPQFGCLLFIDAKTMTEVARVCFLPTAAVPVPMHGLYVPKELQ